MSDAPRMDEFDPAKIYTEIVKAGEAWADLNAAAELLEEAQKSVLAELMNQAEGSMAAKEAQARADPVYKLHCVNMVNERKEANKARVRYDAMRVLSEMRRSQESTRRAEMTLR